MPSRPFNRIERNLDFQNDAYLRRQIISHSKLLSTVEETAPQVTEKRSLNPVWLGSNPAVISLLVYDMTKNHLTIHIRTHSFRRIVTEFRAAQFGPSNAWLSD